MILNQNRIPLTQREVKELVQKLFEQMRIFASIVLQPGATGYLLSVESIFDCFPGIQIAANKNEIRTSVRVSKTL